MAGVNKVILVGNLGKDPEMRRLDGGVACVNFTLATTEYYKDKEGKITCHDCISKIKHFKSIKL